MTIYVCDDCKCKMRIKRYIEKHKPLFCVQCGSTFIHREVA